MSTRHVLVVFIALMFPALALGMGADHPAGEKVNNDGWPKGLSELVNAPNRVHGYFVNWEDVFFLRGDAAALNTFLERYAQLPNTTLRVVLHEGKAEVKSPWDERPRDLAADWAVYASQFERKQFEGGREVKRGPFVTRVDVWLGGAVSRADLKIPANVPVTPVATEPTTAAANEPAFLKHIPELRGVSLDITEQAFLDIVKARNLSAEPDRGADGHVDYLVKTPAGEQVMVMFTNGDCTGIQRLLPTVPSTAK